MGRPATGHRQYNLQHLQNVHHEVMRLLILGIKHRDIARMLDITPAMVSYTANSTACRQQISVMQGARDADAIDLGKRIKELAPKALEVLDSLMDDAPQNVKLSAAKDILDRAGYTPVTRVRTENFNVHFTKDEILEIKNRAKEIGLVSNDVIEGELVNANNSQAG